MYLTTPKSAVTASFLSRLTSISIPAESLEMPRHQKKVAFVRPVGTQPNNHSISTLRPEADSPRSVTGIFHERNHSDTRSIGNKTDGTSVWFSLRRTTSKASKNPERRASVTLPEGWRPTEAPKMIENEELANLQKQAQLQAMRFEVLQKQVVDRLSEELRHLDDRTADLRRTWTLFRAGRRNLHSRICQHLSSARGARFSHESLLKQKEALAELDASIDDWLSKLEHAENRRTRVHQKLLEHIAAATTLASNPVNFADASESFYKATSICELNASMEATTPPLIPSEAEIWMDAPSLTHTPQCAVVRIPSGIPKVPTESHTPGRGVHYEDCQHQQALARMESIRIYADIDVDALLSDVNTEFTKRSGVGRLILRPIKTTDISNEKEEILTKPKATRPRKGTVVGIDSTITKDA